VFPLRHELGFYIQEDGILHSHRRENLKCYILAVLVSNAVYSGSFRKCLMISVPRPLTEFQIIKHTAMSVIEHGGSTAL
jgi:hypothetical protein